MRWIDEETPLRGAIAHGLNRLLAAAVALVLACGANAESTLAPAAAQAMFARTKDKLIQVRTIHALSQSQASIGSGFIASPDGLVITNYHVVSQYVLDPDSYRMESVRHDGSHGKLEVLAIDVANDLALLKMPGKRLGYLRLHNGKMAKGDRGYAMGNPLDLGLTVVEGTYNGALGPQYHGRIHFTGPINAGMSGGPAVGEDGTVFGVNVARQSDGQLVSFLVSEEHVRRLLEQPHRLGGDAARFAGEVAAQLDRRQAALMQQLLSTPLPTSALSHYTAPDVPQDIARCWGDTSHVDRELYTIDTKMCVPEVRLYVSDSLQLADIRFMHRVLKSKSLGAIRFANLVERYYIAADFSYSARKEDVTAFRCQDDFISNPSGVVRAALCVRAYRKFEGLYDLKLRMVTLGSADEALLSSLELDAVGFHEGMRYVQRYVSATAWTK
jgi:serine protease Do